MKEKEIRINKILDYAGKALEAEGVKFLLGAVDRPNNKVYARADISGEDYPVVLMAAEPTRQDAIHLGIYVGQLLNSYKKNEVKRT